MAHSLPPASRPSLRSLEIAAAVAQCGSLTQAADMLGLTHGAVSRQVKALEASLGLRLFDRHARGVRPTFEGEKYLRSVQRSLDDIDAASERWYQRRGRYVVRVGVTPTFAYLWMLRNVRELETGTPSLRVEVHAEPGFADIERGEVDCVIRYTRDSNAGRGAQRLITERLCPVGPPALAEELGPRPEPEAFLEYPLLHDTDALKWRAWFRDVDARPFRPSPRDRRFENYLLTLEAARAGLGIALGQYPVAGRILRGMGLVRLWPQDSPSPMSYYLITRPDRLSAGMEIFLDRLTRRIASPGDCF